MLRAFGLALAAQGAAAGLLGELFGGLSANEVSLSQAPAVLDCEVSSYGPWTPCSERCGPGGSQRRTRSIVRRPTVYLGGMACPAVMEQTRACNTRPCATAAPTPCPAGNSPCECTCLAQATAPGQDWGTACAEACGDDMRTRKVQIHLKRDDHKTAAAQAPVAHEVPTAPAKQVAHPNARLALRQHGSDPRKLDVMISNDKHVGGFRFTLGTPQHGAAPVGKASGGAAAELHYGTATNAKSGAVFGFSDEPNARIPMSDGEVGDLYHVLVSVELPVDSPYKSWHAFSTKLCVWDVVLSDGDGGELAVADSCSPLADPLTPAPTPAPTPKPDYLDLTLRLSGVTSEAFDAAPRRALQAAVAVGTMVPPSAVRLVDVRAGGGDGFYYLDVRYALAARTLQDVNKMETLIVGDEAAFVATLVQQLRAAGQPNLVTADDVSLRKLKVSGGFEGAGASTTAAPAHCASVWMAWSACTVPCGGGGTQLRSLTASAAASNADAKCPLSQTRACGEGSCAPTAAPTPPPTPPPTPGPTTLPPTPRPTQWFERVPTPAPTPRVTREGEVFTSNECSHTTCRVMKMRRAEGKTTHVVRVLHANAEQRGVRHRCMYNDVQQECLCKCSSKDEELCPAFNPGCMTQNHGATREKSVFVRTKGWVNTPVAAPTPPPAPALKSKSAFASP